MGQIRDILDSFRGSTVLSDAGVEDANEATLARTLLSLADRNTHPNVCTMDLTLPKKSQLATSARHPTRLGNHNEISVVPCQRR